jgi:hypothetical protein
MSRSQLATLLNVKPMQITRALRSLHSVLTVPDLDTQPIRTCHASFFDFLTDPSRCTDNRFYIDPPTLHDDIALHCLGLMKRTLKKNICNIPRFSMNEDVEDLPTRRNELIRETLEYACRFWFGHLQLASREKENLTDIIASLKDFTEHRFLYWTEVLSIVKDLGVAVRSLQGLQI